MPIYPFICESCGEETELWQKMNDAFPLCSNCAKPMKRQIGTGTDFILTGGGWYGKARTHTRTGLSRKNKKNQ